MTKATEGLRLAADKPTGDALAKAGAALAKALGGIKADELLASMSDEQKAALAETLAPEPKAADVDDDAKADAKADDKPEDQAKDDGDKPKAEVGDRSVKVFASEHSQGKERLAGSLMADFPSASADEIIAHLGRSSADDGEGKPDQAMLDAMKSRDAEIGEGGTSEEENPKAKVDAVWDRARANASNSPNKKEK